MHFNLEEQGPVPCPICFKFHQEFLKHLSSPSSYFHYFNHTYSHMKMYFNIFKQTIHYPRPIFCFWRNYSPFPNSPHLTCLLRIQMYSLYTLTMLCILQYISLICKYQWQVKWLVHISRYSLSLPKNIPGPCFIKGYDWS